MKALLFVGALAASAMTIVPTVAEAAPSGEGPMVTKVGYSDLDLSTADGRARLDQRIEMAIHEVCQRPSPANLREYSSYKRCAAEARAATGKVVALALSGSRGKARKA